MGIEVVWVVVLAALSPVAYNKAQNEAKNEIYHNQVDSLLFSLYLTVPEIH